MSSNAQTLEMRLLTSAPTRFGGSAAAASMQRKGAQPFCTAPRSRRRTPPCDPGVSHLPARSIPRAGALRRAGAGPGVAHPLGAAPKSTLTHRGGVRRGCPPGASRSLAPSASACARAKGPRRPPAPGPPPPPPGLDPNPTQGYRTAPRTPRSTGRGSSCGDGRDVTMRQDWEGVRAESDEDPDSPSLGTLGAGNPLRGDHGGGGRGQGGGLRQRPGYWGGGRLVAATDQGDMSGSPCDPPPPRGGSGECLPGGLWEWGPAPLPATARGRYPGAPGGPACPAAASPALEVPLRFL